MRTAKSARMGVILGASLVATVVPEISSADLVRAKLAGIDSGSILGIDSGSVDGIDSGSIHGIDSGSVDGIDSGSIHGIDSGSVDGIDSGSVLGIDSGSVDGIDSGSSMVLAGPVQSIDRESSTFVSIGQTVVLAGADLATLRVGDFVTVSGSIAGAGRIDATEVLVSPDAYVPGSTEVFLVGIPSSIDRLAGTTTIGKLKVDYTPSLGDLRSDGFGAAVKIIGTQPALGGTMLGQRVIDRTDLFLGGKLLR